MRMTKELVKVDTIIAPVAGAATGRVVDRKGYRGVILVAGYGAITSTAAVFTATVKEGDATGSMTSVADADLIGTEAGLGLGAAVRTDFSGDKVFRRISYKGTKRYVQVDIAMTVTAAAPVSVVAVLTEPEVAPVA